MPVSVRYTVPALPGRPQTSAVVTVSVTHLTDAEVVNAKRASITVLESEQPPVTAPNWGQEWGRWASVSI